jgi:hypothetical protein
MAAKIEEICDGSVHADESLRLKHRFESPHPPFPHPGRLVGEFDPIVRVSRSVVDRFWDEFPPRDRVAPQLVRHDRPGLSPMAGKQASEESLGGLRISSLLEQHINDLTILVDRPPQVPLLASDSNEDLINEERVAVATVPAPQSKRIPWSELIAP